MAEKITPAHFHEASGVADWRVLGESVGTVFTTGSFSRGVQLIAEIGRLADEMNHHPDVDLRYTAVTVRTRTHEVDGLSELDVELARRISQVARTMSIPADPSAVQDVQIAIDALDVAAIRPFWQAVLDYRPAGDVDLVDPRGIHPLVWFQHMQEPRTDRNRFHLDVWVAPDQAEHRRDRALAAGGRLITAEWAPAWWVLADAEGNEACIATWQGASRP